MIEGTVETTTEEARTRSPTVINRAAVRRFILQYAGRTRRHRYTQVAPAVYDELEAQVREACRRLVHRQPSKGKTIR